MKKENDVVVNIDLLKNKVNTYMKKDWPLIQKAYSYALKFHEGQKRESGEDYIIHPLYVAYILSTMHADANTICAALLHDVIEDTKATYNDIKENFGDEIAFLVDGVTKLTHLNFNSKDEFLATNIRRIIVSITEDARIVIIKLVDRLHNMKTIEYKKDDRGKEIALQTLEIYVPLAYYIGAYKIKSELENYCLMYLKPEIYGDLQKKLTTIYNSNKKMLHKMLNDTKKKLNSEGIKCNLEIRYKDIYSVYKKMLSRSTMENIHDLLGIVVTVKNKRDCYLALMNIHELYVPLSFKFKDFIVKPKTNMYQALHTTVFGPGERLVQFQIRTKEMERIAKYGLTSFWFKNRKLAKQDMQKSLEKNFPFFKSIEELDSNIVDNIEFVKLIKRELFSDNVYVRTSRGEIIELPNSSTPIDFAYKIHSELGNTMIAAVVNDEIVPFDYKLQNNDRVRIITDSSVYIDRKPWLDYVVTIHAKKKINEYLRDNENK
jgi:GTP pyrophosphokinase